MECNITVSSRYGSVWCIMSRYNGSVNGYFICDNGRFGYEWLNGPERVKDIFVRSEKGGLMKKAGQESYYSTVRSALEGRKVA